MAQKTLIELVDDLDGAEAESTTSFSLDGVDFEIDLSAENRERLEAAFAEWIGAARRTGGRVRRPGGAVSGVQTSDDERKQKIQAMRGWAAKEGLEISDRGRIAKGIEDAYDAAQAREAEAAKKPAAKRAPRKKAPVKAAFTA